MIYCNRLAWFLSDIEYDNTMGDVGKMGVKWSSLLADQVLPNSPPPPPKKKEKTA